MYNVAALIRYHERGLSEFQQHYSLEATTLEQQTIEALKDLEKLLEAKQEESK